MQKNDPKSALNNLWVLDRTRPPFLMGIFPTCLRWGLFCSLLGGRRGVSHVDTHTQRYVYLCKNRYLYLYQYQYLYLYLSLSIYIYTYLYDIQSLYYTGGLQKWWYPNSWMIWWYHHFRKPPFSVHVNANALSPKPREYGSGHPGMASVCIPE